MANKILIIDAKLPEPNRDSGSLRMHNLIEVLTNHLCRDVTMAVPTVAMQSQPKNGVPTAFTLSEHANLDDLHNYLRQHAAQFDVIIVSRVTMAACLNIVRRHAPRSVLIFDTVDLHYLREYRGARLSGNRLQVQHALQTKSRELAAIRVADCTFVVSSVEKRVVENDCPGADVQVVSNIHHVSDTPSEPGDRTNALFVGSFFHGPNVDAAEYIVSDLAPRLQRTQPCLQIVIIGENPPKMLKASAPENVAVLGHVEDITPFLRHSRLSIAPLRFGAGVKGKVLQSMAEGLPVVATTIANEGIAATHNREIMIADTADETAAAIAAVTADDDLWQRLSDGGRALVRDRFSFAAATRTLDRILNSCIAGDTVS